MIVSLRRPKPSPSAAYCIATMVHMGHCLTSALFCLVVLAAARADEAVLRDGRRLSGQLKLSEGRWQFEPKKGETLNAAGLREVRLTSAACPALHASLPMR